MPHAVNDLRGPHLDHRLPVTLHEYPARATARAGANSHDRAMHAQYRVEELGYFLGFPDDVMPDQRTPKAGAAGIGQATVDQLPIEEQYLLTATAP
jgi:hypothetical protein